jgi:hypothetical protein
MTNNSNVPSLGRSILLGAVCFAVVSLCVFATVAFGERWMYRNIGELGAYLVWTALFILLGGAAFGPILVGRWRLPRFYLLFGLAFFAYAIGWVAVFFAMPDERGEWLGSLVAAVLMALVFAAGFGVMRSVLKFSVVLFIAHCLGYFTGLMLNVYLGGGRSGMLLWGLMYGLGLGAGIGAVLHFAQTQRWTRENS